MRRPSATAGADRLTAISVESRSFEDQSLIPRVSSTETRVRDTVPDNPEREVKGRLERESGVQFHLKTFRSTFAQAAKDRGVSIEAVSRALGHRTTLTTERYYARMKTEKALAEFEQAFAAPEVRVSK